MSVVYIDKAESPRHIAISSAIGQRRALNVTALGKCLVAFDLNADLAAMVTAGLTGHTPRSFTEDTAWAAEIERVRGEGVACDN